jgi:hypothetical protein
MDQAPEFPTRSPRHYRYPDQTAGAFLLSPTGHDPQQPRLARWWPVQLPQARRATAGLFATC